MWILYNLSVRFARFSSLDLFESEIETNTQVMCEGKEHAIAIGTMVMEPQEIKDVNKGIGIEVAHYLNDGLWHLKHVK